MTDPSPRFHGIYPMLYAYFDRAGALDRHCMRRQVDVAVAGGAHGVAVLGLATEVNKLSDAERRTLVDWVVEDLEGGGRSRSRWRRAAWTSRSPSRASRPHAARPG